MQYFYILQARSVAKIYEHKNKTIFYKYAVDQASKLLILFWLGAM
jgi:hypothetical protein